MWLRSILNVDVVVLRKFSICGNNSTKFECHSVLVLNFELLTKKWRSQVLLLWGMCKANMNYFSRRLFMLYTLALNREESRQTDGLLRRMRPASVRGAHNSVAFVDADDGWRRHRCSRVALMWWRYGDCVVAWAAQRNRITRQRSAPRVSRYRYRLISVDAAHWDAAAWRALIGRRRAPGARRSFPIQ